MKQRLQKLLTQPIDIAPLAVFRILFGGVMLASILRFIIRGWVAELYIEPQFFFTYYGFEWVKPLGEMGMYAVFGLMALSALGVMLGYFYRFSAALFFLAFTYVELIDKTNYLNHYYFVSIVSFLMIWLPAHRYFSLDVWRNPSWKASRVSAWYIHTIKLQLGLVYFFAGVAKLHPDWALEALPLKIWLPAYSYLPVVGPLFEKEWVAYGFSWFGLVYDLTIPFLLLWRPTRGFAYLLVLIFHLTTWWLFPIGMFPFIMILSTLIFFPAAFHQKILALLRRFAVRKPSVERYTSTYQPNPLLSKALLVLLGLHFCLQVLLPLRHHLYPGPLFWTEEGYRFSWRVMLMEKAGTAFFYIKDPDTGRHGEVVVGDYLTPNQEKMMSTQPDMILQFAHFLDEEYRKQGIRDPEIRVESYVTLNGSGSRLYLDSSIDLTLQHESLAHKNWILPFEK